eukprot:g22406.t1
MRTWPIDWKTGAEFVRDWTEGHGGGVSSAVGVQRVGPQQAASPTVVFLKILWMMPLQHRTGTAHFTPAPPSKACGGGAPSACVAKTTQRDA